MRYLICLVFFVLLQTQCGSNSREQLPYAPAVSPDRQRLEVINKYLSEKEQDVLQSYAKRQQLDMRQSSTGYFYQLVEEGRGRQISTGDVVQLYGSIFLISGTLCYTYGEQHPLEVAMGSFYGITALNTALLGVREGSRVRFLIPAHLAFGLLGDGDKVPPRSSLVCDFFVAKVRGK
jgi:FKBP-type peptidyl-prolyl cis-trans isomerase